jgi:hypothetical protein
MQQMGSVHLRWINGQTEEYWSYQRSWSTDDLALVVVLGSVAGAEELVLGGVPRHDASQVGADGVDTVGG